MTTRRGRAPREFLCRHVGRDGCESRRTPAIWTWWPRSKMAEVEAGRIGRARWARPPRRQGHEEPGRGTDRGSFGALVLRPLPCGPAKTLHSPLPHPFPSERVRRRTWQQPPSGLNHKLRGGFVAAGDSAGSCRTRRWSATNCGRRWNPCSRRRGRADGRASPTGRRSLGSCTSCGMGCGGATCRPTWAAAAA